MSRRLLDLGGPLTAPAVLADGESFNYGDLERRSQNIACHLLMLGLKAGDRFAFLLMNSANLLCCYIACARAGIVGVPISQRVTGAELVFQVRDSGARALLYGDSHVALVDEQRSNLGGVNHFIHENAITDDNFEPLTQEAFLGTDHLIAEKSPFCVMYTGGTTGSPKAAVQSREAWICCLRSSAERWRLSCNDRHLIALPMSHAAWFTAGATLHAGGSVTILRNWDPDRVLDLVEQQSISTLNMIPTMLGDLLEAFEAKPRKVASIRLLTVAGSVLPIATYRRACGIFGEVLGNVYGLTEAAGPVTFLLPADMQSGRLGSVGKPLKDIELAVLDEGGTPMTGDGTGEIGLAGPQITTGYLGRPDETRHAFSGKWFLTGDIGRLDSEGYVYIVDRRKDMIKTGGMNVYPSEVEQILYRQPEVLECAVLGVPDPKWTEAVHAAVVLRSGATCSSADLISRCREEMAGYKIPKQIHFVLALPRTSFGKFDKAELRRQLVLNGGQ